MKYIYFVTYQLRRQSTVLGLGSAGLALVGLGLGLKIVDFDLERLILDFIWHGLARKLYCYNCKAGPLSLSALPLYNFDWRFWWWETVGFLPDWRLPILCADRYLGFNLHPSLSVEFPVVVPTFQPQSQSHRGVSCLRPWREMLWVMTVVSYVITYNSFIIDEL